MWLAQTENNQNKCDDGSANKAIMFLKNILHQISKAMFRENILCPIGKAIMFVGNILHQISKAIMFMENILHQISRGIMFMKNILSDA